MAPRALILTIFVVSFFATPGHADLHVTNYYGDHMVLQRGPQRAVLTGTATKEGDTVTAQIVGHGSPVTGDERLCGAAEGQPVPNHSLLQSPEKTIQQACGQPSRSPELESP
ncbi:hypothetical protein C0Q70_10764 [Pomacea canaliculata]|uniref:Uncharacterized protein n=1 Tax=Pomacea canaliculata TaxID=400727 RepID=A0A2T7P441_POMCA|nr:hypothetical protein C0Q70_10764 [Pomacea canaliculata]